MNWEGRRCWWRFVHGSNLVMNMVKRGAKVGVLDDLRSAEVVNIKNHLDGEDVEFIQTDLGQAGVADRGGLHERCGPPRRRPGRGYVDLRQPECGDELCWR